MSYIVTTDCSQIQIIHFKLDQVLTYVIIICISRAKNTISNKSKSLVNLNL